MKISGNFSVSGLDATRGASQANAASNATGTSGTSGAAGITPPTDKLDLSPEALALNTSDAPEVFRADKVADIRQQIADGSYDTDAKFEAALSKMFDAIG